MKTIPLTQGKVALVDDADYEWLSKHKWYAYKSRNNFYAARNVYKNGKWIRLIHMHRAILNLKPGDKRQCDHQKHNGLDNRRDMIRICTNTQNQYNQSPQKNCSSTFKGVTWEKNANKWRARIQVSGKDISLGYFHIEAEAAKAYDKAAIKHYGEFAWLNFKNGVLAETGSA